MVALSTPSYGALAAQSIKLIMTDSPNYLNCRHHCRISLLYKQRMYHSFRELADTQAKMMTDTKEMYFLSWAYVMEKAPKSVLTNEVTKLNKSCPLPDETPKTAPPAGESGPAPAPLAPLALPALPARLHGRRLRQRQEKNYFENARRSTGAAAAAVAAAAAAAANNSVRSLQLSPHKADSSGAHARQLSQLKSTVQSYFRAEQTYSVLARRQAPGDKPAYLIQWDSNTAS